MIDMVMLACPVSALSAMKMSMVMSALGSVVTYIGQAQAASRKKAYQDNLAKMQREAGYRKEAAAIAKNIQIKESTARKGQNIKQQAAKVQAKGRLSAIEGGVTGLSVHYLLEDYEAQEGAYLYSLAEESRMRNVELGRHLKDVHLSTEQQMFATNAPINTPSPFAAAFGAANSFYSKWGEMRDYEEKAKDFKDPMPRSEWLPA